MDASTRLLAAQDARDVRRLHPDCGVWHLARPGLFARSRRARIAQLRACRTQILRDVFALPLPKFICHPDPPADYEVAGRWERVADETWLAPDGLPLENDAAASWLDLGCWVTYAAPRAVTDWPDMFRLSPDDSMRWIRKHGVRAAVSSFHDDIEWRVVITDGARDRSPGG